MKKRLLSIIVLTMLVTASLIFTGCADVNYSTIKTEDGGIIEQVTATLNEDELISAYPDVDITMKKNEITALANNTLVDNLANYVAYLQYLKKLATAQNWLDKVELYTKLMTQIKIAEPCWENNKFTCMINFESASAYNIYYRSQLNFHMGTQTVKWMYTKHYFNCTAGDALHVGLYNDLSRVLTEDIFPGFSADDANITYSYLAPSHRYHSNANFVETTSDGYLHTWIVSTSAPDQALYFYVIELNRSHFYLISIIISLIVCIILFTIAIIIVSIKRKKNKRLIEKLIKK